MQRFRDFRLTFVQRIPACRVVFRLVFVQRFRDFRLTFVQRVSASRTVFRLTFVQIRSAPPVDFLLAFVQAERISALRRGAFR